MSKALDWGSLRVLCIDENKSYGRLVERMLRDLTIRDITLVFSEDEAREQFNDASFDYVIMNCSPEGDRVSELTEFLRNKSDTPAPNIPVIWTVDAGTIEQITTAIRHGADHVLIKPVSVGDIESTLKGLHETPTLKTDVANYIGPCRRRLPARVYGPFAGQDRRDGEKDMAEAS